MGLGQFFERSAARLVSHLPASLGQEFLGVTTLGSWGLGKRAGDWYENNGHFKFSPGQKIDVNHPMNFGYGLNPQGWTVKGYEGNKYLIETNEGEIQKHFKWNIEFHFKIADPHAKPLDPHRFKRFTA